MNLKHGSTRTKELVFKLGQAHNIDHDIMKIYLYQTIYLGTRNLNSKWYQHNRVARKLQLTPQHASSTHCSISNNLNIDFFDESRTVYLMLKYRRWVLWEITGKLYHVFVSCVSPLCQKYFMLSPDDHLIICTYSRTKGRYHALS